MRQFWFHPEGTRPSHFSLGGLTLTLARDRRGAPRRVPSRGSPIPVSIMNNAAQSCLPALTICWVRRIHHSIMTLRPMRFLATLVEVGSVSTGLKVLCVAV